MAPPEKKPAPKPAVQPQPSGFGGLLDSLSPEERALLMGGGGTPYETATPPVGYVVDRSTGQAYKQTATGLVPASDAELLAAKLAEYAQQRGIAAASTQPPSSQLVTNQLTGFGMVFNPRTGRLEPTDTQLAYPALDPAEEQAFNRWVMLRGQAIDQVQKEQANVLALAAMRENVRQADMRAATERYTASLNAMQQLGQLSLAESQRVQEILANGGDYLARAFESRGEKSPLAKVLQADQINALKESYAGIRKMLEDAVSGKAFGGTGGFVPPALPGYTDLPEPPKTKARQAPSATPASGAVSGAPTGGGFSGAVTPPARSPVTAWGDPGDVEFPMVPQPAEGARGGPVALPPEQLDNPLAASPPPAPPASGFGAAYDNALAAVNAKRGTPYEYGDPYTTGRLRAGERVADVVGGFGKWMTPSVPPTQPGYRTPGSTGLERLGQATVALPQRLVGGALQGFGRLFGTPAYESGGYTREPVFMMNEMGPELVENPKHAPIKIHDAESTQRMVRGGFLPHFAAGTARERILTPAPERTLGGGGEPAYVPGYATGTGETNTTWMPGSGFEGSNTTPQEAADVLAINPRFRAALPGFVGGGGLVGAPIPPKPAVSQWQLIEAARKNTPPAVQALFGNVPIPARTALEATTYAPDYEGERNFLRPFTARQLMGLNQEDLSALGARTNVEYNAPLSYLIDQTSRMYGPSRSRGGGFSRFLGAGGI